MRYSDRVRDTTTTTGTGTITITGAAATPGYQAFASFYSVGEIVPYCIAGQTGTEFEVGIGTLASSTTITRNIVLESSNADALVSLSAGTKDVFVVVPAAHIINDGQAYAMMRGFAM